MKRACCLIALLGLASSADADVRIFVTSSADGTGLTVPANAFTPTFSTVRPTGTNINAYDYYYHHYVVAAYPPETAPSGTLANPI